MCVCTFVCNSVGATGASQPYLAWRGGSGHPVIVQGKGEQGLGQLAQVQLQQGRDVINVGIVGGPIDRRRACAVKQRPQLPNLQTQ
jgi:hypothetical protein